MKRSRLVLLAVTTALTISAFATVPAAAVPANAAPANSAWICEDGCWSWDINNGCTQEVTCCANSSSGSWFCIEW